MNNLLKEIKTEVYDKCQFQMSNFRCELEGKEYEACRFELNTLKIISRNAKITPKKIGQFVTLWKRNENGPIAPFHLQDEFDFCAINVMNENRIGQFVFPKSILFKKGVISTDKKEGKRGVRVYSAWDEAKSKHAVKTQKWQLDYFYEIEKSMNLTKMKELYSAS